MISALYSYDFLHSTDTTRQHITCLFLLAPPLEHEGRGSTCLSLMLHPQGLEQRLALEELNKCLLSEDVGYLWGLQLIRRIIWR
jgi:hypothetical protein